MSAIPSTRPMLSEGLADALKRAQAQVNALVLGKTHEVRLAFVALLSDGHLLIEDLPGLGKTTLAHALAATLGLDTLAQMAATAEHDPGGTPAV